MYVFVFGFGLSWQPICVCVYVCTVRVLSRITTRREPVTALGGWSFDSNQYLAISYIEGEGWIAEMDMLHYLLYFPPHHPQGFNIVEPFFFWMIDLDLFLCLCVCFVPFWYEFVFSLLIGRSIGCWCCERVGSTHYTVIQSSIYIVRPTAVFYSVFHNSVIQTHTQPISVTFLDIFFLSWFVFIQ